jgi:hypothetical protein
MRNEFAEEFLPAFVSPALAQKGREQVKARRKWRKERENEEKEQRWKERSSKAGRSGRSEKWACPRKEMNPC